MVDDQLKLLQGSREQNLVAPRPTLAWFVTNQLNLFYMVGAGMLMPPTGFGCKYFRDTLVTSPGWIPLFFGKRVPADALTLSTQEASHLLPVILELDVAGLDVPQTPGGEPWAWFPAPLPTTRIKRILFKSDTDKEAIEADARDYGNVTLADFKRKVMKTAFDRTSTAHWPPAETPASHEAPLQPSFALGAVAAMLLHLGNRGALSTQACRAVFDPADAAPLTEVPLSALAVWAQMGSTRRSTDGGVASEHRSDAHEGLFWGTVERLVEWRVADGSHTAQDVLLSHLEGALETLEPRARVGAKKLFDTLESLTGLGASTISELFSRHQTPLARSMILFFLRESCADLLDFEHGGLNEVDRLAAAILFGVRDGWLAVPAKLREPAGLGPAVSDRMAALSHRIAGTGFNLGVPSPRPRPLRELFTAQDEWSKTQDRAAQELVHACAWDCTKTQIRLGYGAYGLLVDRAGTYIETSTEPEITKIVDKGRFFHLLATEAIEQKVEGRIRSECFRKAP